MGGSGDDKPADSSWRFDDSCLNRIGKAAANGAFWGVLGGAALQAWYPDPYQYDYKGTKFDVNLGVRNVVRNLKAPVLWSSLVCGVYAGVECVMEGMRDESHGSTYVNSAVAGAAAGLVMGGMTKRMDIMATSALGVGMIMGMAEANGQKLASDTSHANIKWNAAVLKHNETTVDDLKEKYPEFKHL
jgi:hypothetical protein